MRRNPEAGWAGRVFAGLIAAVAVAALALQYMLILELTREQPGPLLGTLRFASYFTILSNLAVALAAGHAALARPGVFASASARGAIALYIAVTGGIYFLILRHLWQPQGGQWWADTGLHYATPLLYVAWWLAFAPHGRLRWRDLPGWLLFPALYVAWVFLRGAWLGEYPYPFIDVAQLGWPSVLMNSAGMLLVFLAVGGVLVALDGLLGRWPRTSL